MFLTLEIFDTAMGKVEFYPTAEAAQAAADKLDCWAIFSEADLKEVTGPQLVAAHNRLAKELHGYSPADAPDPVNKFSDKATAATRVWRLINRVYQERLQRAPKAKNRAKEGKPNNKPKATGAAASPRATKGINLAPKDWVKECRAGSKQQIMVDLLSRDEGATLDQLREALSGGAQPWADQTIKAGFNWDMNSLKGYGVRTEVAADGTHVYHLVIPAGHDIPEPRKVAKAPGGDLALHSCDTIAETTDGLSEQTVKDLRAAMQHAALSKVNREDAAPQDVLGENTPAKLWKHLSGWTQHELLVKFG